METKRGDATIGAGKHAPERDAAEGPNRADPPTNPMGLGNSHVRLERLVVSDQEKLGIRMGDEPADDPVDAVPWSW
ncbi:MAG: hypothetical protein WCI83_08430 [Thermoleophilia bacterium]